MGAHVMDTALVVGMPCLYCCISGKQEPTCLKLFLFSMMAETDVGLNSHSESMRLFDGVMVRIFKE